ncbi:hypothetical protein N7340_08570 [Comamonas aquatica]|uniref:hypothetical protein n=1 Tax=Comamonas aquatica TaxID=225991 RepID=UPI0024493A82|nr:hypothetical protein [Comamonas aquatica]MDH0371825.1 hypothetical protein [Comamonas aquatica]
MTVSTAVKWAVSSMTGAPTLNGTAGSMITLLDAFLVNGFGTKAVDSATVTDGICRLAITGASAAMDHSVIQLAGITGSGVALNGLQRLKTAAAGYVEFPCDLPDGALTGTITFKIAPLGWEKVFSKTNVAVYRSTDPAGTRAYYRVDDTQALYARVQMYEAMSDVDTGVAAAPQSVSGGYYWYKRQSAGATGVYWVLCGDSRGVLVGVAAHASSTAAASNGYGTICHPMGDLKSYRSGDPWCAVLSGAPTASFGDSSGCIFSTQGSTGLTLQRVSAGLGGAVQVARSVSGTGVSGADATLGPFPSRADNGFRLSKIALSDGAMASNGPRGDVPGVYHCPQSGLLASMGADVRLTPGQGDFAGAQLLTIGCGGGSGAATGCGVVDVTSDWRA